MNLLIRIRVLNKFFLLLILVMQYPQAQWVNQISPINDDLIDIQFVDKLNGWAVSETNIIATTDGGTNWVLQNLPNNIFSIEKIQFVNTKTGYIIGNSGLLLKSTDGGTDWKIIETGFTYNLSDIDFINDSTGWVSGWEETDLRTGVIMHTTDGGLTWEKQIEKSCNCLFGSTIFMAVNFLDDSVGWALGGDYADNFSSTYIYYTENSGEIWSIKGVWESWPLINLKIISKDTLWTSGGPLVASFNTGETWTCPNFDNPNFTIYANAIAPINGLEGWAIHLNPLLNQYGIYYTSDTGETWGEEVSFDESYALEMTNVIDGFIWVAGKNGLVMKREDINSVENNEEVIYRFQLMQNYPNPFNPTTQISFSIPQQEKVKLVVYDVLGRKVAELMNETMEAGKYNVDFDGSSLSSGTYIYKITAGFFTESKKMLMIK